MSQYYSLNLQKRILLTKKFIVLTISAIDRSETKTKHTVKMETEKNITPTTGQEETETGESKRETTHKNTVNNERKPISDLTGRTTLLY